ncbi:MAG: phosphatidylserine decarboxylase [Bdellovibrionota bacterium]
MKTIPVYDLSAQQMVEEKVYGGEMLDFAYRFPPLRALIGQVWVQKFVSNYVGDKKKSPQSREDIEPFLKSFNMSLDEYVVPEGGFKTFNDFFIREKKEVLFPQDPSVFASPCDARLSVSRIENGVPALKIKGKDVLLPDLLGSFKEKCPQKGWAFTFRLCPLDYHRFHFVDEGVVSVAHKLGTQLHSVNPWALQQLPKIFEWNERQLAFQASKNFGELLYLEVGAMCVGRIHQSYTQNTTVLRGQEKGYFDFGASTQVLIVGEENNKTLKLNPEILKKNEEGIEVLVRLGEELGQYS